MKLICTLFTVSVATLLSLSSAHAADAAPTINRATLLTQACFACHGADGNSVGLPIPTIRGQTEAQLTETLLAFKSGTRPATLMNRIAKGYSDEDLKLIAAYLAQPVDAKPAN